MSAQLAAKLNDLPEVGAIAVQLDGQPVAIVRAADGSIHAISDICSHAEVALSEGEVDGCEIECWLHGARFDLRTGQPSGLPATLPVPVYPVTIQGDDILVDITAPIPSAAITQEK